MLTEEMPKTTTPSAGASAAGSGEVALALGKLLADTHALYLKTHGFHWNVRGPQFPALHQLFEQQYKELWGSLDELAERIRALGALAPQGHTSMANLTGVKDGDPHWSAQEMLRDLLKDHEQTCGAIKAAIQTAERAGDAATVDLLNDRLAAHEKHAWMLRATLAAN
ncbi:MAG: DNA starvation/stationary phase protection protein [Phenylobacterium sp.]|uniref:Dps family protein n=1 Tax=Phenylobacterium sp. TaxID=1871053 RepID=UPI001A190DA8|nr:DNA starvation/stationary phase protection protein [Phenylobacterium sp.]MBJ7409443.1 DNA starvation/stationary phase protection protein [Phenylobacterium sp.]